MTTGHAGLAWRRSSYSGTNGDCVEVALDTGTVAVRDSKDPAGGHLETTPRSWTAFVGSLSFRSTRPGWCWSCPDSV